MKEGKGNEDRCMAGEEETRCLGGEGKVLGR